MLRRDCGAISGTVRVLAFITKSTPGQRCFVNLELEISSLSEAVAASHARQREPGRVGKLLHLCHCCNCCYCFVVSLSLCFLERKHCICGPETA